MKKVLLIDYYGTCDKDGNPIGHSAKVLKEYAGLLEGNYAVSAAVSPCLVKGAGTEFEKVFPLKYDIQAEGVSSLWERIKDKLKLFYNIHEALCVKGYDVLWFYRTDFFLFFYFFLRLAKKPGKMVAQVYQGEFASGRLGALLNFFYKKGALKFDGLIYTQKELSGTHQNALYIPDYYYDEKKYGKYKSVAKTDKAVCLGTMNPFKKLEELVDVFNANGISLEVKGYFYDKERFQRLCDNKKENILMEDAILTEEDYYETLAGAKYVILPYDMDQYHCRTSGILQEALFLNTTAVAPKALLEQNGMEGLGYTELSELADRNFWEQPEAVDNRDKLLEFDIEKIKEKLLRFLEA